MKKCFFPRTGLDQHVIKVDADEHAKLSAEKGHHRFQYLGQNSWAAAQAKGKHYPLVKNFAPLEAKILAKSFSYWDMEECIFQVYAYTKRTLPDPISHMCQGFHAEFKFLNVAVEALEVQDRPKLSW